MWVETAVSSIVASIIAYLTIRFGPDRREISRIAKLVENQRLIDQFRVEVLIEDKTKDGVVVIFKSDREFVLREISLANQHGVPMYTKEISGDTSKEHRIPLKAAEVQSIWGAGSGADSHGRILYTVQIDERVLDKSRPVVLTYLSISNNDNPPVFTGYIRMR